MDHEDAGAGPDSERSGPGGQVDARLFLELSQSLRAAYQEVEASGLTEQQRARWQRRLVDISETAKQDLAKARTQLDGLRENLRREADA